MIGILQFITDVGLYILITHAYRNFALRRQWQMLGLGPLLKRLIPAAIILGTVFLALTMVKVYGFSQWLMRGHAGPFLLFFQKNWTSMYMAGIRLMSIWLLAFHLYYYGKRETALARENARLALIAKDAQFSNLAAQLNPHFLFNSLNMVKALVAEDPVSARRAIDLLSDLLRTALYDRDAVRHPVKNELELVNDYLELEKLRLEERLRRCVECAPELYDMPILRYSIQVLVENAVKHGISRQKSGGCIGVAIRRDAGQVHIEVRNPGPLRNAVPLEGLGLKNLRERLDLQYRGMARFEIAERDGCVLATMQIPEE